MPSDSWFNELDCLINEVHRKKEELNLFGSYVKERKFETTARARDWTAQRYNTGDAAAIFGPYMTLEESLMEVRNSEDVTDVKKVSKYLGEKVSHCYLGDSYRSREWGLA